MTGRFRLLALSLFAAAPVFAEPTCADVLARIGPVLADVNCFESDDLTTNNPSTTNPSTPKDNAFTPPLPLGAFTPLTDRATIVLAFPRMPGGPSFPPGPGPTHIEQYSALLPGIELIEPHAHAAFDLLVDHVENRNHLPPSQCIARGQSISPAPARPGSCRQLFVPTP